MTSTAVRPLPTALRDTLREVAADPRLPHLLDPFATERQWLELPISADLQVWLISWPPGTGTGWHDHGAAAGAFTVVSGLLNEYTWDGGRQVQTLGAGRSRTFAPGHIHDVQNLGRERALSVHAYAPRLSSMARYRERDGRLVLTGVEVAGVEW